MVDTSEFKPFPAVTVCPMSGFKEEGFYFKVKDVLKNTYNLSDIISDATYNDTKSLLYDEPIAQQIGKCFSLKNHSGYEWNHGLGLSFKTSHDVKVFIHEKGDELWFSGFQDFHFDIPFVLLDITKLQNYSLAIVSIKEVSTLRHSKQDMPCTNYNDGSTNQHEIFADCSKQSLWRNLPRNITCTIAEMKSIIPANSTMKECQVEDDLAENYYWEYVNYLERFLSSPWEYNCPIPCKQTTYKIKLNYYHKNNARLPFGLNHNLKGHFVLYIFYATFDKEERIESLEYDMANLLVSAGGNLGLFLGFSCLSAMFMVIEWFQAKFSW